MSGQAQLDTFERERDPRGQRELDASGWRPSAAVRTCEHCGRHVPQDLGRVLGDEDGDVHRCLGCAIFRQLANGAAAGQETAEARTPFRARGGGRR